MNKNLSARIGKPIEILPSERERKLKSMIVRLTQYRFILKWPVPSTCDVCKLNPPVVTLHNPQIERRPDFLCQKCEIEIERLAKECSETLGIKFVE